MRIESDAVVFHRQRDLAIGILEPDANVLGLRVPRVTPPASLAAFCTTDRYDRAAHTYGKSYPDYVRGMLGDYDCAPDVVAYPRDEVDVQAVLLM